MKTRFFIISIIMTDRHIHSNQQSIHINFIYLLSIAQEKIFGAEEVSQRLRTIILDLENELEMMTVDVNTKTETANIIKLEYDSNTADLNIYESKKITHQSNLLSLTDKLEKTKKKYHKLTH